MTFIAPIFCNTNSLRTLRPCKIQTVIQFYRLKHNSTRKRGPLHQRRNAIMTPPTTDYSSWSSHDLVKRVTELEKLLREKNISYYTPQPTDTPKAPASRTFDPSKYTTRHIALKFAYLGAGYNGFEHHVGNKTPLPTIEEEIWKALVKCRLIFPPSLDGVELPVRGDFDSAEPLLVDWEGSEYSKCGRTDKGVSAFGQVIGVRVRSAKKAKLPPVVKEEDDVTSGDDAQDSMSMALDTAEEKEFDPIEDELKYIPLLNKVLPPTIRMLAWCPTAPANFDARFSCKERQYRYFFTSPAFLPLPGFGGKEGYLDIEAMQEACGYLLGSHDFRNFCKIDPTKQLTSFTRRITQATVERVASFETPAFVGSSALGMAGNECDGKDPMKLYAFKVQGSAFLWHQVRCMVGILFLIGQGLEKPTLIKELLAVEKNPRKPKYEMASDKPLVLWNCTFSISPQKGKFGKDEKPEGYIDRGGGGDELEWIYANDEAYGTGGKWGLNGLMENLWRGWRKAKMDEILTAQLMDLVAGQGDAVGAPSSNGVESGVQKKLSTREKANNRSTRVFEGDDSATSRGKYIPVMQKEMMEPVEIINSRWMERKGIARRAFASQVDSGVVTPT